MPIAQAGADPPSPASNGATRILRRRLAVACGVLLAASLYGWLRLDSDVALSAMFSQYLFWLGSCVGAALVMTLGRLTRAEWRRPFTRAGELLLMSALVLLAYLPLLWFAKARYLSLVAVPTEGHWPGLTPGLMAWVDGGAGLLLLASAAAILLPSLRLEAAEPASATESLPLLSPAGRVGRARLRRGSGVFLAGALVSLAVIGWSLGMNLVPHWHSTLFPTAYVGASLQTGAALLFVVALSMRKAFGLGALTLHHADQLGKFIIAPTLLWLYFRFADYLTAWYGHFPSETAIMTTQYWHEFPGPFLVSVGLNFFVPLLYFSFPSARRFLPGATAVALGVLVGGAIERVQLFAAVHAGFALPPAESGLAYGMLASLLFPASVGLTIALGLRFVSPLTSWEMSDGRRMRGSRRVGGAVIATYALVEPEELDGA